MDAQQARTIAQDHQETLSRWLREAACPLWSTRGVDRVRGGFHELMQGAEPVIAPRRVRVQPRQIAAFAGASRLGWDGDVAGLVTHGLSYFLDRYRREDGLFRTLIAADGAPLDDRALLYDQAFVLLGLAEAQRVLAARGAASTSAGGKLHRAAAPGAPTDPRAGATSDAHRGANLSARARPAEEARALRSLLFRHFKRNGPGFESGLGNEALPLAANPHMHLFEASMAWFEVDGDPEWQRLADEIGELALSRLIDRATGALREHFTSSWEPLPGIAGRLLEPGHHFEWAWLLLRWSGTTRPDVRDAAFRLIDIAERHGTHNGVAVNALLDDFSIHDACARLWPQTERLKAAAIAARMTGEPRYRVMMNDAATALLRYLQTPVHGSWFDRLMPYGRFIEEPAPASTFYHIVGAIAELTVSVRPSPPESHTR